MIANSTEDERRRIVGALASADEEMRRLAVEQLLVLPLDEAVGHLEGALGDPGWRVRKAAIDRLTRCQNDARIQEMLVGALADGENPGRRNAAFEAIVACGAGITSRLVAELDSEDIDVRKQLVDALAAIADPASREALASRLSDPDDNVRAAAAEALGVVGGPADGAALLELATRADEDVLVRLSALRALGRMPFDVEVSALAGALETSLLRPAVFELLGESTDPEAEGALVKGLDASGRSSREAAIGALLRCLARRDGAEADALVERIRRAAAANDELVVSCCERLAEADLTRRMLLLQFLGLLEDERAVRPILEAGRDEAIEELADRTLAAFGPLLPRALVGIWDGLDAELRIRACPLVGRIGGAEAETLLASALEGSDGTLRAVAALALGRGGFFGRLPDLVRRFEIAAREDDPDGREEVARMIDAIVALAEHPRAESAGADLQLVEILASRLAGAPEPLRIAIARVLTALGHERDADLIAFLLKDESPVVRRAAVQALARFRFDDARPALRLALGDEASAVRIAAAGVLGDSGRPDATEELLGLLGDADPRVAAVALRAMGRLHRGCGPAAGGLEAPISEALEGEALVALAALDALIDLGGDTAGRMAAAVLGSPDADVVRAGVACVGAHGDEASLTELLPLSSHADWSVRAEVVQVVSERGHRKGLPTLLRRLEVEDDAFVRAAILRAVERLEE